MNFATNIHSAFPQLPLLGVDILRRVPDGKLFAIELNAGGNVWHFSSYAQRKSKGKRLGGRDAMVAQLGAWDIAAAALIDVVDKYAI